MKSTLVLASYTPEAEALDEESNRENERSISLYKLILLQALSKTIEYMKFSMNYPIANEMLMTTSSAYIFRMNHVYLSVFMRYPFSSAALLTTLGIGMSTASYINVERGMTIGFATVEVETEEEKKAIVWQVDKGFILRQLRSAGWYMGWTYLTMQVFSKYGEYCENRLLRFTIESAIMVLPSVIENGYNQLQSKEKLPAYDAVTEDLGSDMPSTVDKINAS